MKMQMTNDFQLRQVPKKKKPRKRLGQHPDAHASYAEASKCQKLQNF